MALHATSDLGDAVEVTREFLTPIDRRRWAKLALVAFFVGSGTSVPASGFDGASSGGSSVDVPADVPGSVLPGDVLALVAVIAAVAVGAWLVFAVIGAVMEFVFVESLRSGEVRIRRYWGDWWPAGLRLFAFRLIVGLPLLVLVAGLAAVVFFPAILGIGALVSLAGAVLALPLLVTVGLILAVVNGFTTAFVVPIVIRADCGILAAWRRLWGSIAAEWREYLAYAVVNAVLAAVAGTAAALALGMAALVLLVPFGTIGLAVVVTLPVASPAGIAVLGVLGLAFVLALIAGWALVQVPVRAYLRYYALLVLGDIEGSFDVIPDRRAAVRE